MFEARIGIVVTVMVLCSRPAARAETRPLDRAADLARGGRCSEAIPITEGILHDAPAWGPALYLHAHCLATVGRRHEALEAYRRYRGTLAPDAPARSETEGRIADLETAEASAAKGADEAAGAAGVRDARPLPTDATPAHIVADDDEDLSAPPPPRAKRIGRYYPATIAGYVLGGAGTAMLFAAALLATASEANEREIEDFAINGSLDPAQPGPIEWDESLARVERTGRLLAALAIGLIVTGTATLGSGFAVGFFGLPPGSRRGKKKSAGGGFGAVVRFEF